MRISVWVCIERMHHHPFTDWSKIYLARTTAISCLVSAYLSAFVLSKCIMLKLSLLRWFMSCPGTCALSHMFFSMLFPRQHKLKLCSRQSSVQHCHEMEKRNPAGISCRVCEIKARWENILFISRTRIRMSYGSQQCRHFPTRETACWI